LFQRLRFVSLCQSGKLKGYSSSVNDGHHRKVDDHETNGYDRPAPNPQNQIVPELLFKFLSFLLGLDSALANLSAHIAELAIPVHSSKLARKRPPGADDEHISDLLLVLTHLVLSLESIESIGCVIGFVSEKEFGFGRVILVFIDDLFKLVRNPTILAQLAPDVFSFGNKLRCFF
jgi:hypothetical protein